MKKLFMTMLTVLACGAAYALPVGNPSEASLLCDGILWEGHCGDPCDPCLTLCDAFSFRVGFYGDYVFNRHLEGKHDKGDVEHSEITTNAFYMAANLWDRFDVFGTVGVSSLDIDTGASSFVNSTGRFAIESDSHFSWSVGARGTLWECGCFSLGLEGQYFYTKPHVTRLTVSAIESIYPDNSMTVKYQEWQVGLGVSYRINMFVPYAAIKWAHANVKMGEDIVNFAQTTADLFDMKQEQALGYAIGVSLVDCEKAALTVEGRFAGEKALYVNGQFRF